MKANPPPGLIQKHTEDSDVKSDTYTSNPPSQKKKITVGILTSTTKSKISYEN